MDFQVKQYSPCPCGSGKPYKSCHSPTIDKNRGEENHWRGPGFDQSIYFGQDEMFHGMDFKVRGEIVLFEKDVKYPLCNHFVIDESYIAYKTIIKEINIIQDREHITYSGVIELEGDSSKPVPILIGIDADDPRNRFEALLSGSKISAKKDNWLGFIDNDSNPLSSIQRKPHWFRFFAAHGHLIWVKPREELHFELSSITRKSNIFTICLPFQNIDLSCPRIIVSNPSACFLEFERENVYWDLILHKSQFNEEMRRQKDSEIFDSIQKDDKIIFINLNSALRGE